MADEFGAFSSGFSQPSQKRDQRESAWASWPTFQEGPPPIDDFDDEDDDEFGTFASASNTVTSLERGNSQASVSTPDSSLPPLPNGGWPHSSMLSPPLPGHTSASEELNIDELAKEIDAISQDISLTLPVSGPQCSKDDGSLVTSEGNTLQDSDNAECSGPLGFNQSGLPVISADGDFGGIASLPGVPVARDVQIESSAAPVDAVPDKGISEGTFLHDMESESVRTSEVTNRAGVVCTGDSNLQEDSATQRNDCETTQQLEDDFGDFESMQCPPEKDLHSSQCPPEEVFVSSQHPSEHNFGDFGTSQSPSEEQFGDIKSTPQHPLEEDFGNFGSTSQHPLEEDFGDFGSSSQHPPEEEFGNFGSAQFQVENKFGDFGSAAPTHIDNFGDFSAAPDTVQDDFGSFSSASALNANSTANSASAAANSASAPKPSSLTKEAILELLSQCFPASPPGGLPPPIPDKLYERAVHCRLWQAYKGSRDMSATTTVYHWEYSDIQDKFYYSAHVDPAMAPPMSTQQFKSALQMEDFSVLLTANKESSSPMSSPPGTPTQLTSVLLDLSFQSAEAVCPPSQTDPKEMFTLDADLLGLDLTAAVQQKSTSENMGMGLEDSLQLGGATKDVATSSQAEVDDSFSSFVHADPLHPSHQEPANTVQTPYMTVVGDGEDEDEFTSFSSAEPSTVPFTRTTQPAVTLEFSSTTADMEAGGDIFSDFASALPPVTTSSDLALPSGVPGALSHFANLGTLSASNFTNVSELAKPASVISGPISYPSNGSVPTSGGDSSMLPSALLAPSHTAPAATTATISSPEPLTAQAQQLFDRVPDVRFMLSNVLLSPKSFL